MSVKMIIHISVRLLANPCNPPRTGRREEGGVSANLAFRYFSKSKTQNSIVIQLFAWI